MKNLFICYPKCTTCQKAKKWLNDNKIEYEERHIAEQNPTASELKEWYLRSSLPLKNFFNTNGQIYRSLKVSENLSVMNEEEQISLLSSNGMLVKRPILVNENTVLVGFNPIKWEHRLIHSKE